ncbi:MAG: YrdB family protein [Acidobacteriota bacterium]|nr:YrdB family protein [Acidobacteriota bacterium]
MSRARFFAAAAAVTLEVALVAAYSCAGLLSSGTPAKRFGIGFIAVCAVIALWAAFAAPEARRRLAMPSLLWFKFLICGAAAGILLLTHQPRMVIFFVCLSALALVLEAGTS